MISSKSRRRIAVAAGSVLLFALVGLAGCGEAATGTADGTAAKTSSKSTPARDREKEDRGDARFSTAGTTWVGTRASARLKDTRLRISASKSERIGDLSKRDQLNLNISDFTGPGKYKASMLSMFVRVSIKIPKSNDEPVDAKKVLMDALGDTNNIRLANADIEITSVSGGYIDGIFSIDRPAGTPESIISDGQFHARIRE